MSMTVKAYLKRGENANAEIRRFVIDVSVSSSYEYLSKKVAQVFPSLGSPENFSLSWKDSEGDNITFSSDDELMEALGQINDDIFRIYVKEKKKGRRDGPCQSSPTPEDGAPEDQAYHPGVICDGCECRIRGPRFKCITCPDYDLCKQCEGKGLHPEHSFVKFRKPQVGRSHHGGFFNRPGMFRQFGHPGWRRWWQWNQQQQQQGQGCGAGTSSQQQQDQSSQGTSSAGPQMPGGCPMGAGPFFPPPPPPPGCNMPPPPPPHAFLRDIGQTVAQMLDPLGIDVDIDIEQQGNRTHCAGETNACGGRGKHGRRHGGKGRGCRKTWAGNEQASSMDVGQEAEQGPAGDARSQEKSGEAAGGSNMEQEAMQKQPEGTTEPMETTMRSEGAGPSQTASAPPASNQSPSGSDDADWTMLENAGGNPTPPSQNPQEDYQYQTALNQMTAMGFDNEGGWLTSLLEAKGGDIGRVLDAIKIGTNATFSVNLK